MSLRVLRHPARPPRRLRRAALQRASPHHGGKVFLSTGYAILPTAWSRTSRSSCTTKRLGHPWEMRARHCRCMLLRWSCCISCMQAAAWPLRKYRYACSLSEVWYSTEVYFHLCSLLISITSPYYSPGTILSRASRRSSKSIGTSLRTASECLT
jgi:hypothetical protein